MTATAGDEGAGASAASSEPMPGMQQEDTEQEDAMQEDKPDEPQQHEPPQDEPQQHQPPQETPDWIGSPSSPPEEAPTSPDEAAQDFESEWEFESETFGPSELALVVVADLAHLKTAADLGLTDSLAEFLGWPSDCMPLVVDIVRAWQDPQAG